MGIEFNCVLPVKDHLSAFKCNLCANLVTLDGYVTIPCGHCFCRGCFQTWTRTQHPKGSACGCPKCGVSISSSDSERVVNWQVRTLVKAEPLAHQMLSQVKVVCPCRFTSPRICYWTGSYADLKQHVDMFHARPTEANELPSKSGMTLKSASEHQRSTIRSCVEVYPSDCAKLNKSGDIRKSSPHQEQEHALRNRDKAVTDRMPMYKSASMPDMTSKSNSFPTKRSNVIRSGHCTGSGLDIDGALPNERKDSARDVSMGLRWIESNLAPSISKSNEYISQKETTPSSSVAMRRRGPYHRSDYQVNTSDDACKSSDRRHASRERSTRRQFGKFDMLAGSEHRPGEASNAEWKSEPSKGCLSKELAARGLHFTKPSLHSVETAIMDTTTNRVRKSRESTRSELHKSGHSRRSSPHRQKGMHKCGSMPETRSKSNSCATNSFNVIRNGHHSGGELDIVGTHSSEGKDSARHVLMGSRSTESTQARSVPKSFEYQSHSLPVFDTTKETMPSPNAVMNMGGRNHRSDAVVKTSDDTIKTSEKRQTRERNRQAPIIGKSDKLSGPAHQPGEESTTSEPSKLCQSKELATSGLHFTKPSSHSVEKAVMDTTANRVCKSREPKGSAFQEENKGLRENQSENNTPWEYDSDATQRTRNKSD